jgi:phage gp36-like protein
MPYASLERLRKRLALDVLVYLVDDEQDLRNSADNAAFKAALDEHIAGSWTVEPFTSFIDRIEEACREADSEADSYIGQKYTLPLPSTPDVLVTKALDLAVWRLFLRRGVRSGTADEALYESAKASMAWFKDVAVGKASLPLPASSGEGSVGVALTPAKAKITSQPRIFSRDTMGDF